MTKPKKESGIKTGSESSYEMLCKSNSEIVNEDQCRDGHHGEDVRKPKH